MRYIIIVFIAIVIMFKYFEHTDYPSSIIHQPQVQFNKNQNNLDNLVMCAHLFSIAGEEQKANNSLVHILTLIENDKDLRLPKTKETKKIVDKTISSARTFFLNPNTTQRELAFFYIGLKMCIDYSITEAVDLINRRSKKTEI